MWRLVDWLHQLDPQARPGSASDLADLLISCEQHMADPESHPLPQRLHLPVRRRRMFRSAWLITAVGGLLLVMGSAAAIVLIPPAGDPGESKPALAPPAAPAEISPEAADHPVSTASKTPPADPRSEAEPSVEAAPLEEVAPPEEVVGPMLDEIETSLERIFSELHTLQESKP